MAEELVPQALINSVSPLDHNNNDKIYELTKMVINCGSMVQLLGQLTHKQELYSTVDIISIFVCRYDSLTHYSPVLLFYTH